MIYTLHYSCSHKLYSLLNMDETGKACRGEEDWSWVLIGIPKGKVKL
jgi:hypothetical protein